MKTKAHKPKSVKESIDLFQEFLECDAYTKLRPETTLKIKGDIIYMKRQDYCKNEKEFIDYLRLHFNLFRKELKTLGLKV